MKSILRVALTLAAVGTAGCVAPRPMVELPAIGPWHPSFEQTRPVTGTLVVYSARDAQASVASDDAQPHSDYEVLDATGGSRRRVSNRVAPHAFEPAAVELSPGRYIVVARGGGGVGVRVPVAIEPAKTTFVHLDGSELSGAARGLSSAIVKTPEGATVGWRAHQAASLSP